MENYNFHKIPSLYSILVQMNPVRTLPYGYVDIHFNISSHLDLSYVTFHSCFLTRSLLHFSKLRYMLYGLVLLN
jgi:hypothetical protein